MRHASVALLLATTTLFAASPASPSATASAKAVQARTARTKAAQAKADASLRWTPASYHGLALGRSRRSDAVRLLGRPDSVRRGAGGKELAYEELTCEYLTYKARGDHGGELAVRIGRSGTIVEIKESFPVAIPRSRIYRELGPDAVTAHFRVAHFDAAHSDAAHSHVAEAALYRDPAGSLELTLYPAQGIVLWPDQIGYDFAAILYLAQPLWRNRCPASANARLH